MFLGDDFHHNGAFRLSYGFEYVGHDGDRQGATTHFAFDRYDTFEWYLKLGPLSNVNAKYFHGKMPDLERLRRPTPTTTSSGRSRRSTPYLTRRHRADAATSPAGGTRRISTARSRSTRRSRSTTTTQQNFLVVGPWNHGGWSRAEGEKLGQHRLRQRRRRSTSATASRRPSSRTTSRTGDAASPPRGHAPSKPARTSGGTRTTVAADAEASPSARSTSRPTGALAFDAAVGAGGRLRHATSPIPPTRSPTARGRSSRPTIRAARAGTPGSTEDQRFVDSRPDVLS